MSCGSGSPVEPTIYPRRTRDLNLPKPRQSVFVSLCVVVMITLSFTLPKAGLKVAGVPVSPALVLVVALGLLLLAQFVLGRRLELSPALLAVLIIYGAYFSCRLLFVGVSGDTYFTNYVQGMMLGPVAFLVVVSYLREDQFAVLLRVLVVAFFVVTLYAIAQAVLGINTVAIPGVTVNLSDYLQSPGQWYVLKFNNVDGNTKIVSTYQNGNVLGAGLVLWFPVVYELLKPRWRIVAITLFVVVVALTLSRSAWFGALVYLVVRFVLRRPTSLSAVAARVVAFIVILALSQLVPIAAPQIADRFTGTTASDLLAASGRVPALLMMLRDASMSGLALLFGPDGVVTYSGGAYEIVLGAVFVFSGLVGVLILVVSIVAFSPVPRFTRQRVRETSPLQRGVMLAIVAYFFVSLVDGAFWLPPAAINLWILLGIAYAERNSRKPLALIPIRRG